MQISLDDLYAFLTIHREGSFALAAEKLLVSSPALTRRIKKLESLVGDQVFDRSGHRIQVTSTGRALLSEAESLVWRYENFSKFATSVAREYEIEVNFASILSVAGAIAPGLIRGYLENHPKARFNVQDCDGIDARHLVEKGLVEFAITTRPPAEDDLVFEPLCSDPLVLVVPQGHPLYERRDVNWRDLADHRVMVMEGASSTTELIDLRLKQAGIAMPSGIKVQQLSTLVGFVQRGGNAAVLPKLSAEMAICTSVRLLPIHEPDILREIGIAYLPKRQFGRASTAFLDWLRQRFLTAYRDLVDHL